MLSLRDLQSRFAAVATGGLLAEQAFAGTGCVIEDAPGAAARLAIHVHHFRLTLIDALGATFPVIRRVVGEAFFTAAARRYVLSQPPQWPCLFEYGEGFPAFVSALPEARSLGYLADLARLEWAINRARHAEDVPPLDAAAAAAQIEAPSCDLFIGLGPSCRLIKSAWPVDRIWQVHQQGDDAIAPVDLAAGGVNLFIHRQDGEVGWLSLDAAAFAFIGSLRADGRLGKAHALARAITPSFNASALLVSLFEGGVVTSVTAIN
ncbi:MAG: DNA-binding domain-containing protein [Defluviicoccus sp.]